MDIRINTQQDLNTQDQQGMIKDETKASAVEVKHELGRADSDASFQSQSSESSPKSWTTKLLRIGPLIGIGSIILTVLSMLVSLGILLGSRNAPVPSWTIPPSTYLAICTAVQNQAIRFAAFHGVAIAWWVQAIRGSTLARLHTDWHSGTHLLGAIASGPKMGILGLACIFSTLVSVDGPLLQKATTIVSAPITNHPVSLSFTLSPELPLLFSGGYVETNGTMNRWAQEFNATIPASTGSVPNNLVSIVNPYVDQEIGKPWLKRTPLNGIVRGCPGECSAKVRAPAFDVVSCRTHEISTDWNGPWGSYAQIAAAKEAPPLDRMAFIIQPTLMHDGDAEHIDLVTAFSESSNCKGTLIMTACTLASAIGEYDITVTNNSVVLPNEMKPNILSIANNTAVSSTWNSASLWYDSTLGGLVELFMDRWGSYEVQYNDMGQPATVEVNGFLDEEFAKDTYTEACKSFKDPQPIVLSELNRLAFYSGAIMPKLINGATTDDPEGYFRSHLDAGLEVNSTIIGQLQGTETVFKTELIWFLAAAVVEGICIALILPTYYGWWQLGRAVSFSPLEIAKAFEAPILSQCSSNSSGREMANLIGSERIRYGVVRSDACGGAARLAFASPGVVKPPSSGCVLDV